MIEDLEAQLKDSSLKALEQEKTIQLINKKFDVLKERESKYTELQIKFDDLLKKVDDMSKKIVDEKSVSEAAVQSLALTCEECDFVSRSESGLKVHIRAKHTEQTKIKCRRCDFTCESVELMRTHNDNPCG